MVNHCAVGGCNNRQGRDTSSRRCKASKKHGIKELTPKKWRYLAYKSFVNLISSQDLDRKVRYVLPSCVVSAIREKFPNTDGSRYTGFISIGTDDGHILP